MANNNKDLRIGWIFDLDGTLINSTDIFKTIEKEIFKKFQLNPDEKELKEVEGLVNEILHGENRKNLGAKLLLAIFKKLGLSFVKRIKALSISGKIYKREIKKVRFFEGVDNLFDFLDENSYRYAVATTSSAREVDDRIIKYPDYYNRLEGKIVSRSSVENLKPHPESFQKAAEIIGLSPERCVMVGDMHTDIMMGKKVGAVTIGVLSGAFTEERLLEHDPDLILDTVADIPKHIDKIKELVENN